MGLKREERRALNCLAEELAREDPEFARALTAEPTARRLPKWTRHHRRIWFATCICASLVTIVFAVALVQPLLFEVGGLGFVACCAWFGTWAVAHWPKQH